MRFRGLGVGGGFEVRGGLEVGGGLGTEVVWRRKVGRTWVEGAWVLSRKWEVCGGWVETN